MAKVLLRYTFLFDPAVAWTQLSQFEADLVDFFAANDIQADIITPVKGQLGDRIMELKRLSIISRATNNNTIGKGKLSQQPPSETSNDILKQMRNTNAPVKDFKQFQNTGVPKEIFDPNKRQEKLKYDPKGRINRQKVYKRYT